MELDDGLGDDEPTTPLLPPDDRLWRHPSEVAAHIRRPRPPRRRGKDGRMWPVALLAGLIGAILATGVLTATGLMSPRSTIRTVVQREAAPPAVSAVAGAGIVEIADRTRPAMVEVRETGSDARIGAGVVFRSDGWVLTSHQAVLGVEQVSVVLDDGSSAPARVAGRDPETNIAVLKVDRTNLTPALLGSVSSLKVGQVAVVVGGSLSVGVLSALGQEVRMPKGPLLLDMIQTDAPVQPSSAGGALVDNAGAVIGIATSIDGSGYATPIDVARDVAEQFITSGKVLHGWLGIDGDDLSAGEAAALGVEGGAVVRRVRDGSPAAAVGLAAKDVVVAADGATIESMTALKVFLRSKRPGQAVDLTFVRGGKQFHAVATLTPR
ncbi:MAG TPA: trypsin-like peptidase domain-containing protein, partial [Acidimicrobiales bacterium]